MLLWYSSVFMHTLDIFLKMLVLKRRADSVKKSLCAASGLKMAFLHRLPLSVF